MYFGIDFDDHAKYQVDKKNRSVRTRRVTSHES